MEDTICISKQTFQALVMELQSFVKQLDRHIHIEEKHRHSSYDAKCANQTSLEELFAQKVHALQTIAQVLREAILTSSQRIRA